MKRSGCGALRAALRFILLHFPTCHAESRFVLAVQANWDELVADLWKIKRQKRHKQQKLQTIAAADGRLEAVLNHRGSINNLCLNERYRVMDGDGKWTNSLLHRSGTAEEECCCGTRPVSRV